MSSDFPRPYGLEPNLLRRATHKQVFMDALTPDVQVDLSWLDLPYEPSGN